MASAGGTEPRDIDARLIALFGVALAGFILLSLIVIRLLYGIPLRPVPFGFGTGLFERGLPALQIDPRADRQAYEAEKDRQLHGYAWIDRADGIARIPIEEAMRVIADNGVPDWGQKTPPRDDECTVLMDSVPRAPQAGRCFPTGAGAKP